MIKEKVGDLYVWWLGVRDVVWVGLSGVVFLIYGIIVFKGRFVRIGGLEIYGLFGVGFVEE